MSLALNNWALLDIPWYLSCVDTVCSDLFFQILLLNIVVFNLRLFSIQVTASPCWATKCICLEDLPMTVKILKIISQGKYESVIKTPVILCMWYIIWYRGLFSRLSVSPLVCQQLGPFLYARFKNDLIVLCHSASVCNFLCPDNSLTNIRSSRNLIYF